MTSILWKWRRIRAMAPAEIVYRAAKTVATATERRSWGWKPVPHAEGSSRSPWPADMGSGIQAAAYSETADKIMNGDIRVFALRSVGFPPKWNRCPKTGIDAPIIFGKSINYRDPSLVGDIKYLWEPNRHLELVSLAQAWRLTGEREYADAAGHLLQSWLEACPYPVGPNWVSSLELGIRLTNWSLAWHLLGGEQSPLFEGAGGQAFRSIWVESIYRHQDFIANHLSLHSSANNHLLGEYLGLFIASVTWPLWPQSKQWERISRRGFEDEALRQNAPDGVNREQAVYYQHEVITMMILAGVAAREAGQDFSPAYWKRLELLLEFITALMDVGGNMPMIGDADDGQIVRLDQEEQPDPYSPLLAAGAVLFRRGDFAAKAKSLTDFARWLLPGKSLPPAGVRPPRTHFPEGGYFILGHRLEEEDEIRVVCDCGPLGYLSISAHGHADALSFCLSADGHEWLIDPGTFGYHCDPQWRDHFRATGAHNTARIDSVDQSEIGGTFLWLTKAHSKLIRHDPIAGIFVGEHDGYSRLPDPVRHRRRLELDGDSRTLLVTDQFDCRSSHRVELSFQFAETVDVQLIEDRAIGRQEGSTLEMKCSNPAFRPTLIIGRENPPDGWVSRHLDIKVPAPMVRWFGVIDGPTTIRTSINLSRS